MTNQEMIQKARELGKKFETMDDHDFKTEIWENPRIIFAMLDLLLRDYAPKGVTQGISNAYILCMDAFAQALTEIRYSVERNHPWATDIAQEIQIQIAEKALAVEVDIRVQKDLIRAINDSGLKIHSKVKERIRGVVEHLTDGMTETEPQESEQLFELIIRESENNPLFLYDDLMAELNLMSVEEQLAFIGMMIKSPHPLIQEISVVLLLHPDREVRRHIPALFDLLADFSSLKPRDLRRMIGLRNWLPEEERPGVDGLIRKLRLAKVACAPMPLTKEKQIYCSSFDGSGTQAVWVFVQQLKKYESTNLLFRQAQGIFEVWNEKKLKKSEVKTSIAHVQKVIMGSKTKKSYLDRITSHFIQKGLELGNPPPPLLLYSAETLGDTYWIPKAIDTDAELTLLEKSMNPGELSAEAIDAVLEKSKSWPYHEPVARGWFEDDSAVDDLVKNTLKPDSGWNESLIDSMVLILNKIIEKKRDIWAQRLLFMALWVKDSSDKPRHSWKDFFILARELHQGRPLHEIPLMLAIADQSISSSVQRIGYA